MNQRFQQLIAEVTTAIAGRRLDGVLEGWLNRHFPADGPWFAATLQACQDGIAEGWMCARGEPSLRWGRVAKPSEALAGFSIDVVDMADIAGPHHAHPNGEIDLVMPLTPGATFDGQGAGWKVYGPGTAHHPTVRQGRALVLYLLPQGSIEFSKAA